MFLERRTVSRKTPGDGRLEITKEAAQRIKPLGDSLVIELAGETVTATVDTMACTCRGVDNPHVHYFLESEHFKSLQPGSAVDLELDAATGSVLVRPAPQA